MKKYNFLSVMGFTLLEMLIVITIIGILASLAIPQFTKTIETAKAKEAVANLEVLRTAERMYYLDNNKYTSGLPTSGEPYYWNQLVPDYLPENPNANANRNWNYGFSSTIGYPLGNYIGQRTGGAYKTWPNGKYLSMDLNGNMINNSNCAWPWPPN